MSSRQGAAMICTPIGIGSSGIGTATTGNPMNEIGWVWMPILARTGSSTPSSTKVFLADLRRHAGRRRRDDHIDRLEQLQHLRAIPAAEFLRPVDQGGRHHGAGDQPVAHRRIEIVRALCAAGRDAAPRLRWW